MRVCIPTGEDKGLSSVVYGHFGSAPHFIICDTASNHTRTIDNRDVRHEHGACLPAAALGGERVDAVVAGGIGARALVRLTEMGIRTYRSTGGTAEENLQALSAGRLAAFASAHACQGHPTK